MNPCLADTGLGISLPIIGAAVLLVAVGVGLFVFKRGKKKGAAGAATLVLLLFGAVAIGTIGNAAPAQAATPGDACGSSSSTTPLTPPTQTSTPIVTPTPPPPTCDATKIDAGVDGWAGEPNDNEGPDYHSRLTDDANSKLIGLLASAGFTGTQNASVAVVDLDTGAPLFAGTVSVTYGPSTNDPATSEFTIPGSELETLIDNSGNDGLAAGPSLLHRR